VLEAVTALPAAGDGLGSVGSGGGEDVCAAAAAATARAERSRHRRWWSSRVALDALLQALLVFFALETLDWEVSDSASDAAHAGTRALARARTRLTAHLPPPSSTARIARAFDAASRPGLPYGSLRAADALRAGEGRGVGGGRGEDGETGEAWNLADGGAAA
jgi:hypothetical protein